MNLKIIEARAPTTTHWDEEVEEFYEDLETVRYATPTYYTIIMVDFNAKMGIKQNYTEVEIRKYGYGVKKTRKTYT